MKSTDNKRLSSLKTAIEKLNSEDVLSLNERFFDGSSLTNMRTLFSHLISGKIKLKIGRTIHQLSIELNPNFRSSFNEIQLFLKHGFILFEFYLMHTKDKSFKDFKNDFFGKSYKHTFIDFIYKKELSNLETKILIFVFGHFLENEHPVYLSEIKLNPSERYQATQLFLELTGKIIEQELLNVQIDNGIIIRISPSKRAVLLMNGIDVPVLETTATKSFEFYTLVDAAEIKSVQLHYNSENKKLFDSLEGIIHSKKHLSNTITTLLYGPSGTGKTEFVYQLARKTNALLMHADYTKIISKWIGESEKNIKKLFKAYHDLAKESKRPVILLLNEADGLMNKRIAVNHSNDIFSNQLQAQILELLENFKGTLIATTNVEKNMDDAFQRRFLFKSKVDFPSIEIREKLINTSKLSQKISKSFTKQLIESDWSPAQLVNCEIKIDLLNELNEMNQEEIESIIKEDGLLKSSSRLGFRN